jgi:hypothetical protein
MGMEEGKPEQDTDTPIVPFIYGTLLSYGNQAPGSVIAKGEQQDALNRTHIIVRGHVDQERQI